MVPNALSSPLKSGSAPVGTTGCVGRNGARCACAVRHSTVGTCILVLCAAHGHRAQHAHGKQIMQDAHLHRDEANVSCKTKASANCSDRPSLALHPSRLGLPARGFIVGRALTPMGPMPGPPPPCGMQNVLCRFRWHTSAPMRPGDVRPTCTAPVGQTIVSPGKQHLLGVLSVRSSSPHTRQTIPPHILIVAVTSLTPHTSATWALQHLIAPGRPRRRPDRL